MVFVFIRHLKSGHLDYVPTGLADAAAGGPGVAGGGAAGFGGKPAITCHLPVIDRSNGCYSSSEISRSPVDLTNYQTAYKITAREGIHV